MQKNHADFLKVEAAIHKGTKEPPFGLLKAAFDEQTFAQIGCVIYWSKSKALIHLSPEEVEGQIQQIVNKRNAEVRRRANVRDDPEKAQKIKEFADMLGMSL